MKKKDATVYNKEDFNKGDFILFKYLDDDYIRGEVVETKDNTAIIEIALSGKKSEDIKTEIFEVKYDEIIPFHKIYSRIKIKK